jgi:hypothetical protein
MTFEAEASTADVPSPAPVAAKFTSRGKKASEFTTTSRSSYVWPACAGQAPAKGAARAGDFVGGSIAASTDMVEAPVASIEKKTMKSEYDSKYAWPTESFNRRGFKVIPDSLWVLGTKRGSDQNVEKKEPVKPKPPSNDNERDHLVGTGCLSEGINYYAPAEKGKRGKTKPEHTMDMSPAGHVPGPDRDILVSKDAPVAGQIPALRVDKNPIAAFNAMRMPRPPAALPERAPNSFLYVGRAPKPSYMTVDPIRVNTRYPVLSAKQANRWATTTGSAYAWPKSKAVC